MSDAALQGATRRAARNQDDSQTTMPLTTVDKIDADGVKLFYHASGQANAPVVLLAASIPNLVLHVPRTYSASRG